jgi:hypothetical protein
LVHVVPAPHVCVITVPFWQRVAVVPTHGAMAVNALPWGLQRCGFVPLHEVLFAMQNGGGGAGAMHWPFWQVLPLPQPVPLPTLPATHAPVLGLQVFVRQAPRLAQLTSGGLEQTPFWHISLPLQALLSEQLMLLSGWVTQPRAGSQATPVHTLPSVSLQVTVAPKRPLLHGVNWLPLHWLALQLLQTVLPGAQPSWPQAWTWRTPFVHVSIVPEGGSHVVRLGAAGAWQPVPGLQVSLVQGLPSLQVRAWPPTQLLFWQLSTPLQALLSLQLVGLPKKPFTQRRIWPLPTHWVCVPVHSLQRPPVQPLGQGLTTTWLFWQPRTPAPPPGAAAHSAGMFWRAKVRPSAAHWRS